MFLLGRSAVEVGADMVVAFGFTLLLGLDEGD